MRNSRILGRLVSISTIATIALFSAQNAHAEADTFGLGSGRTGPGTISTTTVVNGYAAITAPIGINSTTISVDDSSVFAPGDLVLIWETTGIESPVSGSPTATDLTSSPVGRYEYGRVKSVATGTVTLTNPTISAYAGVAQLVRVPEYTTLDITAGGIAAAPWDGTKGGIAVVFANGAVTNAGSFDTSTFGFRGGVLLNDDAVFGCANLDGPVTSGTAITGQSATFNALAGGAKKGEGLFPAGYNTDTTNPTSATNLVTYGYGNLSSGAGGGDCHNSGGGGGGHGGAGGKGGGTWAGETDATGLVSTGDRMVGGLGGTSVTYSPTTHLVFGGGAGAGEENDGTSTPGGSGGGVLVLRAASISGAGIFASDGASGGAANNDGAGGGGAGGLIVVQSAGNADCSALHANGGAGGTTAADHGPGGGGSGGIIYFQAAGGTCAALATEAGGAKGTDGNAMDRGATAGAGGLTASVPAGGFSPTTCDIEDGHCGGCVLDTDCPTGSTCNSATNQCDLADGGLADGGPVSDAGAGDGGASDGGLSDGGLADGGDGGSRDGGSRDGGGLGDGGNGNGDGGSGFGDGGNGSGDGGSGDLFDLGSLEGGGCGCSTPGSSGTGNTAAFVIAAMAALVLARRKRR